MSNQRQRFLGMPNLSQADWLQKLQASPYLQYSIDSYNQGELIEILEKRVAQLLNKDRALFFSKGMLAQFCALKVSAQKTNNNKIIIHPKSHIAIDENNAYKELLGLDAILLGDNESPFNYSQIIQVKQPVATCVIELPLRRAGFKLPSWQELNLISNHSKQHNIHLHMDGARLWESTPFYQKPLAEISDLFHSVYVSLYKGLGGMGGALLAGDAHFIADCLTWRTRLGGDNFTAFPMILSALDGLDNQLPNIPSLAIRAQQIAQQLSSISQVEVNFPQTNGFFIFIQGELDRVNAKVKALNKKLAVKLFNDFHLTDKPMRLMAEIQIGSEHQLISDQEIISYFNQLVD